MLTNRLTNTQTDTTENITALATPGPSRAIAGPVKPFSGGPITTSFRGAEIGAPKASRREDRIWGREYGK